MPILMPVPYNRNGNVILSASGLAFGTQAVIEKDTVIESQTGLAFAGRAQIMRPLTIEIGTKAPLGSAGMTQVVSANGDDEAIALTMPFTVQFYGNATSNIWPCSNMFIALQSLSTEFQSLSLSTPVPAQRTIHLGGADNSWQKVFTLSTGSYYRVRIEGAASTSGTPGAPTIVSETTFFPTETNRQLVEVVFGVHGRTSGTFGISNGLSSGSNINTNGGVITQNQSYVFAADQNGNGWTITAGRYVGGY